MTGVSSILAKKSPAVSRQTPGATITRGITRIASAQSALAKVSGRDHDSVTATARPKTRSNDNGPAQQNGDRRRDDQHPRKNCRRNTLPRLGKPLAVNNQRALLLGQFKAPVLKFDYPCSVLCFERDVVLFEEFHLHVLPNIVKLRPILSSSVAISVAMFEFGAPERSPL